MNTTAEMTRALKANCVPLLRDMGFKGSFPHFYREQDSFVALVNFQFHSLGKKFCINLGFVDPKRRNLVSHCKDVETKKLRLSMTGGLIENGNYLSSRWRVGSQPIGNGSFSDAWFSFQHDLHPERFNHRPFDVNQLAQHCAVLFEQEAEQWWGGRRAFAERSSGFDIE